LRSSVIDHRREDVAVVPQSTVLLVERLGRFRKLATSGSNPDPLLGAAAPGLLDQRAAGMISIDLPTVHDLPRTGHHGAIT